jgi:tetrahydromethanopterin S-methyltransferase subunit G
MSRRLVDRIDAVNRRLDSIDRRLDRIETKLENYCERITRLEERGMLVRA